MSFKSAIRFELLSLLDFASSPDWTAAASRGIPVNALTGEVYQDVNMLLLWKAAAEHGYPSNVWMTFEQIQKVAAFVPKGQRARLVMGEMLMDYLRPDQVYGVRPLWLYNVAQVQRLPRRGLKTEGVASEDLPTDAPKGMLTLRRVLNCAAAAHLN